MPKIILGVSGGIAAYKSITIARLLIENGYDLTVIPTPSALNFVGKATWEAISGKPVHAEVFAETERIFHVAEARSADLVLLAPATADLMYRIVAGAANDMLTATILSTDAQLMIFPAMHSEMWLNKATLDNVATLRSRGAIVIDPATGVLARGDSGIGRLPEPEQVVNYVNSFFARPSNKTDLLDESILVTLGGTQENIDPVRVLTNRSTGEMGSAICRAARLRGASVTAVVANSSAVLPHDITTLRAITSSEMYQTVVSNAEKYSVVVMAAAVSDFTVDSSSEKISRSTNLSLQLIPTKDILKELSNNKAPKQILIGFAAQSDDVIREGLSKLQAKNCDLIVANQVGFDQGFGRTQTEVHLIDKTGSIASSGKVTKDQAAHLILDQIIKFRELNH